MQDQTITFHWRTFEEETPQSGKDILVKTPASPLYWWTRTTVYGKHMMLSCLTYLSQAKRYGLLWCYCDEIDEQAPPDWDGVYNHGGRRTDNQSSKTRDSA